MMLKLLPAESVKREKSREQKELQGRCLCWGVALGRGSLGLREKSEQEM